jgi:hypothetical protein
MRQQWFANTLRGWSRELDRGEYPYSDVLDWIASAISAHESYSSHIRFFFCCILTACHRRRILGMWAANTNLEVYKFVVPKTKPYFELLPGCLVTSDAPDSFYLDLPRYVKSSMVH